jgi:crotonobetainyl-CoA:carnitine CoA-transferase CaiB-like acyl-CoA transferase
MDRRHGVQSALLSTRLTDAKAGLRHRRPDHVAAKLSALTVAAALVARQRDGRGRHLEIAQSDVVLHHLAASAALVRLRPGTVTAGGDQRGLFHGLFPCAGNDEGCVIDARDEREVDMIRRTVAAPPGSHDLHEHVTMWTAARSPTDVAETLQRAGVPAASMVRLPDLLDDPQLRARGTYTTLHHPLPDGHLPTENVAAPFELHTPAPVRPAPLSGEHTVEICTDGLGMSADQVMDLARTNTRTNWWRYR